MAELASKFNVGCVIQYYSDQSLNPFSLVMFFAQNDISSILLTCLTCDL